MLLNIKAVKEPQLPFFLYGTLRAGEANAHILKHVGWRRPARLVGGRIFDLGPYPMLVPGDGEVQGELVEIAASHYLEVRSLLDRFEAVIPDAPQQAGGLYHRALVQVEAVGQQVDAWAYFGCEVTARRGRWIQNGDWKRRFRDNDSTDSAKG